MNVHLMVPCAGNVTHGGGPCKKSFSAPFGTTVDEMQRQLEKQGWVMTVITPAGIEPICMSTMCPECSKKLLPAELLLEYHRRRRS